MNCTHTGADSAHDLTQSQHFWTETERSLGTAERDVGVWLEEESRDVSEQQAMSTSGQQLGKALSLLQSSLQES